MSEQSMAALKVANNVRLNGAAVKRDLRRGKISLEDALEHPDAQPVRVGLLLGAMPRWGPARIDKLLTRRLEMGQKTEGRRVSDLTARQKELIVRGVEDVQFWVASGFQA